MNGHNSAHHNRTLKPVNKQTDMKRVISRVIGMIVIGIMLPAMCQTGAHADEKTGVHWTVFGLSLIHISEPTRLRRIWYGVVWV